MISLSLTPLVVTHAFQQYYNESSYYCESVIQDNTRKNWLKTELHQDKKYTFFSQGVTFHFSVPMDQDLNTKFVSFNDVIFHFVVLIYWYWKTFQYHCIYIWILTQNLYNLVSYFISPYSILNATPWTDCVCVRGGRASVTVTQYVYRGLLSYCVNSTLSCCQYLVLWVRNSTLSYELVKLVFLIFSYRALLEKRVNTILQTTSLKTQDHTASLNAPKSFKSYCRSSELSDYFRIRSYMTSIRHDLEREIFDEYLISQSSFLFLSSVRAQMSILISQSPTHNLYLFTWTSICDYIREKY